MYCIDTQKIGGENTGNEIAADLLGQNYNELDEAGKEKLKEVSEKLLDIWNTVNEIKL